MYLPSIAVLSMGRIRYGDDMAIAADPRSAAYSLADMELESMDDHTAVFESQLADNWAFGAYLPRMIAAQQDDLHDHYDTWTQETHRAYLPIGTYDVYYAGLMSSSGVAYQEIEIDGTTIHAGTGGAGWVTGSMRDVVLNPAGWLEVLFKVKSSTGSDMKRASVYVRYVDGI